MVTRNSGTLIALTALATIWFGNAMVWGGIVYLYDPNLGTLPESQGFTRFENFGTEPAPSVSGGILHQFPSVPDGTQYWLRNSVPLNFATTPYALEANLRVLSSNYIPNIGTGQRSGYYLQATDSVGRSFSVGIASTGITINTDSGFLASNGAPFTPFNTTDGFHTYRLLIDNGAGSLLIDGSLFASTALGGLLRPDISNRVAFGDLSGQGVSETDLRLFRFETTAVPEPSSLVLMLITIAIGLPSAVLMQLRNRVDVKSGIAVNGD